MSDSTQAVAVIGDLVESRSHPDRAALQRDLLAALEVVNEVETSLQPLAPTIGDEFQAVYADVRAALRAVLLLRLCSPDGLDCRFGLGVGRIEVVGASDYGLTQDGSAWWAAREAIDEAERREGGRSATLRSWLVVGDDAEGADASVINAYLLARDEIVSSLGARSRRLALGALRGQTQVVQAEREHITQSAVSQNLRDSGSSALLAGLELLQEST